MNYDPDAAGQSGHGTFACRCCWSRISRCGCWRCRRYGDKKADPDLYIREKGADAYIKLLKEAPPYVDYLIAPRAADGSVDRRREVARGEFSFAVCAENSQSHFALGMGHADRAAIATGRAGAARGVEQSAAERRSEVKVQPELVRQTGETSGAAVDSHAGGGGRIPERTGAALAESAAFTKAWRRKKFLRR